MGAGLDFEFTMAFQPIVNTTSRDIFAHEALVRGKNNEPASHVFKNINDSNRYRFDQACRVKAVQLASQAGMNTFLSINFMPNAVYRPELCIRTTMEAAREYEFPIENILFEVTEGEKVVDHSHLRNIMKYYRDIGFFLAIDDFGAGYSGLNLLAEFPTDFVKLDMALTRNIDKDKVRLSIVKGIKQVCEDLSIRIIAEGIETVEEVKTLEDLGVELFQGFFFAKPSLEVTKDSSINW